MLTGLDWVWMGGLTLFAAMVQSATGFGFALLAVPFYLIRLDSLSAVQIAILVTPVISVLVLPRIRTHISRKSFRLMGLGTLLGLPAGILLFLYTGILYLKIAVGAVVTTLALILFIQALQPYQQKSLRPRGAFFQTGGGLLAGFISGAMTSALAMPGPPLMFYLTSMGLERNAIRATILFMVIFSYLAALALQMTFAGVHPETWRTALLLIPFAFGGTFLGNRLSGKIPQRGFLILVQVLLLATGLYLLMTNLS